MANVIGPDVSFYQDDPETTQGIDFFKMRASVGYVIIRAGQNLWADSDFKANWREAKLAGIPRGSYWYYDSRADPKKQAELWVQQFGGDFGELPLFGDFEDTYKGPYTGWKHWYNFLERLKQLIPAGKEIGVYTGYYYWIENTTSVGIPQQSLEYFHKYPLWIANYGNPQPLVPKPWAKNEWTLWQFTDNGDGGLYGVESKNIDLNYFNGDITALRARFGLSDTPLPDPLPPSKFFRVTVASLKVREGPGQTYSQLGSVFLNETVEEIDANSDRTWLKIRKLDGSLVGWSFSVYLQNIPAPTPDPNPDPDPDPNPDPDPDDEEKNWYRVTVSSLKVREGPGLTFDSLGLVYFGELVEEIGANSDGTWLNIRKADGSLIGWSFSQYLEKAGAPPPPAPSSKWYRVTTTSLNVRESPELSSTSLGHVYFGDFVEELDATSDRKWLKIRKSNGGISGWSFSQYLQATTAPDPDVPPTPVPDNDDKKWYRVNTQSLNIRESPTTSSKVIGYLLKNDTVPALDDSTNSNWMQIQRLDGLTGWCDKRYLVFLSNTRPSSTMQGLFTGITYLRKDLTTPRANVVHVVAIDLQTVNLEFLVTPATNSSGVLCTRTTSEFLDEFKLHLAINADGWKYLDTTSDPVPVCSNGGDPVKPNGYAASRGTVYSPIKTYEPEIYISPRNQVAINIPPAKPFNAFAGDRIVVDKGLVLKNLAAAIPQPRTAFGLSKNGRWLTLMVVDGRQNGYSEGVTFPELGELLISYGVYTGVNLDGGGSSTLVIKGADGKPRVLNSPIDLNVPGKERAVGNHLGLYIKK